MTLSTLDKLANDVGAALKKRGLVLATAESCTGGGLSFSITSISGSSEWFDRGFVTYSNESKIDMLGVKQATLEQFGAVSEATVREMAEGALRNSNATVSIAITGIAGPLGGAKDKPVGTVWIALGKKQTATLANVEIYTGDRQEIRTRSIEKALQMILLNI